MQPRVFQPARLRLARNLRGWTQKELAAQLDVTAAAVSQWEAGASLPGDEALERLALTLLCRRQFFVRPSGDIHAVAPFFRRRRAATVRELDRAAAYASVLSEAVRLIDKEIELPEPRLERLFSFDDDTPLGDVERAAGEVRDAWRLPDGPVSNVVRVLELRGAVVAAVGGFDRRLDAFSARSPSRPVVVLCSDGGAAARRRFDAAHELGHLLMHEAPTEANKVQEDQAHRFAAALLMPAGPVDPWLPSRSNQIDLLEEGSRIWGVSMQALLYRSRTLRVISEDGYQRTMRRMGAAGWRTREPVVLGPAEVPTMLTKGVEALQDTPSDLRAIADELGLGLTRLRRMLSVPEDHDDAKAGQLVELRAAG